MAASIGAYLFGGNSVEHEDAWADAGDISELREGLPQQVTFQHKRLDAWKVRNEKTSAWVILNNKESVTAFSPLCTHLGCAYRWQADKQLFTCPCHGSTFSKTGQVLTGPASRPLDTYKVKMEGNRLWLGPIQISREA